MPYVIFGEHRYTTMSDWRLNGQESYLFRAKLIKKTFQSCGFHDHDHCDFCWDKISEKKKISTLVIVLMMNTIGFAKLVIMILRTSLNGQ